MVAHGGPSGCSLPRVSACRDSLELGDRSFGSSTQRVPRRLCSSTDVFCRGLCSTIVLTIFIVWQLLTFGVFPMIFLCSLVFSPWGDTCLHGVPVHTIICLFIHEYIYTHTLCKQHFHNTEILHVWHDMYGHRQVCDLWRDARGEQGDLRKRMSCAVKDALKHLGNMRRQGPLQRQRQRDSLRPTKTSSN